MNIFVLDLDPRVCAKYHCDKHVVKMIIETAQMLYSVHWVLGSNPSFGYKLAHKNHPCSIWARTSLDNYIWLCKLGKFLCDEYSVRYCQIHKTSEHIDWLTNNLPNLPSNGITKWALAMPDIYKTEDVVESYRNFYIQSKCIERNIVRYKLKTPEFLVPYIYKLPIH
jgi:hypothetical protein